MRARKSSKRAQSKNDLWETEFLAAKQASDMLGGCVDEIPDEGIFFLDKTSEFAGGDDLDGISRKKRARSKVSRVDAILARKMTENPFPTPLQRKPKGPPSSQYATTGGKLLNSGLQANLTSTGASNVVKSFGETALNASATTVYKPRNVTSIHGMVSDVVNDPKPVSAYNLWNNIEKHDSVNYKAEKSKSVSLDLIIHDSNQLSHTRLQRKGAHGRIALVKAVQADAAGCSYNPPEDARQTILAKEVAREVSQRLRRQLNPIKAPEVGTKANAWLSEDLGCGQDELRWENEFYLEREQARSRASVALRGKLTKTQRNKQKRRREQVAEEAASILAKQQRRDLTNVDNLYAEIVAAEDSHRERLAHRNLARKDRVNEFPSRLGKHLYQPEPVPVLLKDELTGSLRTIAGTHSLLRDRLKSLQRRALVETRRKLEKTRSRNFLRYEPGAKGDKEAEMHEEKLRSAPVL